VTAAGGDFCRFAEGGFWCVRGRDNKEEDDEAEEMCGAGLGVWTGVEVVAGAGAGVRLVVETGTVVRLTVETGAGVEFTAFAAASSRDVSMVHEGAAPGAARGSPGIVGLVTLQMGGASGRLHACAGGYNCVAQVSREYGLGIRKGTPCFF
jgi:hypothetical protein